MRRVAHLIHGPVFGGAANQLLRVREPLRALGWDAVGILPEDPGNAVDRLRTGGVEVHRLPLHRARATPDLRTQAAFAWHLPSAVAALLRLLRRLDVDVVQVHGDLNPHGRLAATRAGLPLVVQLLDTRTPPALRRITGAHIARSADVVMTLGPALAALYPVVQRLGPRCVSVLPPIDLRAHVQDEHRRTVARRELSVPEGAVVVGTVGNRNPQKGQDALIRAVAAVRQRHPEAVLRILGTQSPGHARYEASLHAAAREADPSGGTAFGFGDPGDRVPELLAALDVMVVSSVPRSEGVPTVLFEAMASGIACVATDVGAVREAVVDGVTGFVVPALDQEALNGAVERLVAGAPLRADMGAKGRDRAHLADAGRVAQTYAAAYELAISHRTQRPDPKRAPRP